MNDPVLFRNLGLEIATAAGFVLLARVIRMPGIVVYLAAGLVLGPVLGLVETSHELEIVSEAGIVLLLFLVGLELRLDKIREVGRAALIVGGGQVAVCAAAGLAIGRLLGGTWMASVFIAAAVTFSSTVMVVKLLDEQKALGKRFARLAIGVLMIQDLAVILLLTFLAGMKDGTDITTASVLTGLARAGGGVAALLVLVGILSRHALPIPLAWAARNPETLYIWSLCWCFLLVLGAHALGLSAEIGAFVAGLSLAQTPYSHDLLHRVRPLMNFFIAVFFVSLGQSMNPAAGLQAWAVVAVLSAFVLIAKPAIVVGLARISGETGPNAVRTGLCLGQISEFSFILAALGIERGLVGDEFLALLGLTGLVTMASSSYAIGWRERGVEWLLSRNRRDRHPHPPEADATLRDHVLVIGMNSLGRRIVRQLTERGETVLAIDTNPRNLRDLAPALVMHGNAEYFSVLEEAGFPHSKLVVSALRNEDSNHLLAFRCRSFGRPCAIHVEDLGNVDNLLAMDATYLMIPKVDGVKVQNETLKTMGVLNP